MSDTPFTHTYLHTHGCPVPICTAHLSMDIVHVPDFLFPMDVVDVPDFPIFPMDVVDVPDFSVHHAMAAPRPGLLQ